jgi:hypothetical protein
MDEVLTNVPIPPRRGWWRPYEVHGIYECRGVRYRHFFCVAGSVEYWILKSALDGGARRVILMSDKSTVVFGPIKVYRRGEETIISADEVTAAHEE